MGINIPNQITLARLLLAVLFFALLAVYSESDADRAWILPWAFWLFLVAALSDVLDGWLARTLGQVTPFGRVVDPIVDKVMVCGAFAFFAGGAFVDPVSRENVTGVSPWMVVLILLREFTVSALRAFNEAGGTEFAARWEGKLKMFVQSATVCVVLGVLAWHRESLAWLRVACVWLTVAVTTWSCVAYLRASRHALFSRAALGGVRAAPTPREPSAPDPAPRSAASAGGPPS